MSCTYSAVGALDPDQVREVLSAAGRAPAVHKLRPCRLHGTKTCIELLMDLPGGAWDQDDDHREAWVACGAALLNVRLAIRSCGVEPEVHLLPEPDRPTLLATVKVVGLRPATGDGLELARAIEHLVTDARHFDKGALPDGLIVQLRQAARIEQAWIALLPPLAPAQLELTSAGSRLPRPDPSVHLLVVGTFKDDGISRLRAGQAMQRVLLTAARSGLSAGFIAMSADPADRERIRQLIGGGLWPQALLQIGLPRDR